jgi:hypothetical protein
LYRRDSSDSASLKQKIARLREKVWKPEEVAAFADHYIRNATSYAVGAPAYSSAFAIGGSGTAEITGSVMDSAGNVIVGGGFQGSIVFPTSPTPTTIASTGDFDIFFAKYTTGGVCLWARAAHGVGGLNGLSLNASLAVAVDAANNAYFGGGFVGGLTFLNAGGQTAATLTGGSANPHFESFVVKFDSGGNLAWARGGQSGVPGDTADLVANINGVSRLLVDGSGNLFAAGTISATSFLGQTVPYVPYAMFLASLNPATGAPIWVDVTQNDGYSGVSDIATDGQGGVWVLAWSEGSTITFPTSPSSTTLSFDPFSVDSFLTHFATNGACVLAKPIASGDEISGFGLAVSPAGDVFVTGYAWGDDYFDNILVTPGLNNDTDIQMFVVKYNSAGAAQWVRIAVVTNDGILDDYSYGDRLAVDAAGNAYVVGQYSGNLTLTGNPSTPGLNIATGLDQDVFLAQYDASGTPRWLRSVSSPGIANAGYSGSDAAPIYIDSASLYYHAPTQSVMTTGDFVGSLVLDAHTQLSAPGACRYSFAAIWPASTTPPAAAPPTLKFSVAGTGWSNSNTFYADVTVTNAGFGNALNTQTTLASAKMLLGSGTVTVSAPALPASLGIVAPSASVNQRVYFALSNPAGTHRFSLATSFTTQSAAGANLSAAYSTTLVSNQ